MSFVFLNGHFLQENKASIPIQDRGFLFGDGVFTTLRVSEGKPEFFESHHQRLIDHAKVLSIEFPQISRDSLIKLIQINGAIDGLWRLKIIVTGGFNEAVSGEIRPAGCILMTIHPCEVQKGPLSVDIKITPSLSQLNKIKHLAYLDRINLMQIAKRQGFDDILLTDSKDVLLETVFSNIYWFCKGDFFTPDPSLELLKGVILTRVIESLNAEGNKINFVQCSLKEIPSDASVFLCNALNHSVPVVKIGGRLFSRNLALERKLEGFISLKKFSDSHTGGIED